MTGRRHIQLLVLFTGLAVSVAANAAQRVTLFAAASTAPAIQEIATEYKRKTGVAITPVFAASGALARQIDNGGPAELFLSADSGWMEWLARRGRIDRRQVKTLLSNCLVLVQPADETPLLAFDATLIKGLGDGRLALADPDLSPLGAYARAALRAQGLWHRIRKRIALQPDARATLVLAARGEAAAAIVYQTDSQGSAAVRIAARIPASLHPRIAYPIVAVGARASDPAMRFLDYLRSTSASLIFQRFGFIEPEGSCSA